MKILAIETSTEACSAALLIDGEVRERFEIAPRTHAELILGMSDGLLAEADLAPTQLDAVAFGRGPGAFTGVRIATGVAQGIAFAAELPVVPVSTLAALAQGALRELGKSAVCAAIDARMEEIYFGAYRQGRTGVMEPITCECVCRPEAVPSPLPAGEWFGAGSGWQSYEQSLHTRLPEVTSWDGSRLPHAWDAAVLAAEAIKRGETVAAHEALPVYLRDNVAKKAREQSAGGKG